MALARTHWDVLVDGKDFYPLSLISLPAPSGSSPNCPQKCFGEGSSMKWGAEDLLWDSGISKKCPSLVYTETLQWIPKLCL